MPRSQIAASEPQTSSTPAAEQAPALTFNVTELPMEPLLISLKDAAPVLGLSYYGFYELVEAGTIPSVYQGRRRYVTPESLRAYVAKLPTIGPAADLATA